MLRSITVAAIEALGAREILDSRGNPTIEVEALLDDAGAERFRENLRAISSLNSKPPPG